MLNYSRPNLADILISGPNRADLEKVCEVLNSERDPQQRDELRSLVQRWRESGPNLKRMLASDYTLETELEAAWYGKYVPMDQASAHIYLRPTKPFHNTKHQLAVAMFAVLTLNPNCEQLAGPCAHSRCGKYFIRKGKRRTNYCSRLCCQRASAIRHTKRRLEEERKDKLKRARAAIQKWRTARTNYDWRTSVCKQEPDLTSKFLTQAVTRGDLVEPTRAV